MNCCDGPGSMFVATGRSRLIIHRCKRPAYSCTSKADNLLLQGQACRARRGGLESPPGKPFQRPLAPISMLCTY